MLKRLLVSAPIVLIAGLLARIATLAFIDFSTFNWSKPRPDLLMEYGVIARNLAKGLGYSYTWYTSSGTAVTLPSAYMPPGLVFIEYGVISLFGYSITAAIVIFFLQVAMGTTCIWLAGKIAHELFGSQLVTGVTRWIVALYPPFVYAVMTFGITTFVMLTSFMVLWSALRLIRSIHEKKSTQRISIVLGVSCGILMLLRGEGPLIVLITLIVLAIKLRSVFQQSIRPLAVASIIAFAILAPWTIRNYLVFDKFIPVSANGSFNFWRGNNEVTNGSPLTERGDPFWSTDELWLKAEQQFAKGVDFENNFSAIYREAAFQWIEKHPAETASLALKKGIIFWSFDVRNKAGGWQYFVLHTIALAITIFGSVRLIKRRKRFTLLTRTGLSLIVTWAALATIIAMIFLPLARFQIVTMAMLVPIAAYGMTELFDRSMRQKV
jgi:hypothetical protein